jgi:hypothetical protein
LRLTPQVDLSAEELSDGYLPDLPTFKHKMTTPQATVYRTHINHGSMPFGELEEYLTKNLHRLVTEIDQIDTGVFFV